MFELLPKRQGCLLNDILGVRDVRDQGGHVSENLTLAAQEEREEPLLRGVGITGVARRIWRHSSISTSTSPKLRLLDNKFRFCRSMAVRMELEPQQEARVRSCGCCSRTGRAEFQV